MKISRPKRKKIRLSQAAAVLGISRSGVVDQIRKYKRLSEAPRHGDNTSPILLWEAEVNELARKWGLI